MGRGGPLEVSLTVRGSVELRFDDRGNALEGDPERFSLVRLAEPGPASTIAVTALGDGAAVADLCVYAREGG